MLDEKIDHIVHQDLNRAKVLYDHGIPFYRMEDYTLFQACEQNNITSELVAQKLTYTQSKINPISNNSSIEEIVGFLIDSHKRFIKEYLPYVSEVIEGISIHDFKNKNLVKDLKFIFPVFVEDFIHHILDEESTVFRYIYSLLDAINYPSKLGKVMTEMESKSIAVFSLDHLHEDPMRGIRELTNNYRFDQCSGMNEKVVLFELQKFDEDLTRHAELEDQLLFTKALSVEQQVKQLFSMHSLLN